MKHILLLAMAASISAMDNSPYLMKHDTTAHIVVGSVAGALSGYGMRQLGAPIWLEGLTCFAVPCLLGQIKERCHDQNYCGKDANSWVLAGAGAVGIRLAWTIYF